MDVRVGGQFRWLWKSDEDGSQFGFHGEFKEVESPSRIRHTEIYDPGEVGGAMGESGESMVTVTFQDTGGVTTVSTLIDFGVREARDAAVSTGMTDGMEMSYQLLDQLLAEGSVG
jgi:uncharacterized protein YndB with AHSA1/START domain